MQAVRTERSSRPRISHPHDGAGERARLRIEGVRAPIVTTVARRRDDALVVVQELPFLRQGSAVLDDHDRRARIARVAVDADRDVPCLVLELAYEPAHAAAVPAPPPDDSRAARRARDATIGYEQPRPSLAPQGSGAVAPGDRPRSDQHTLVFVTQPAAPLGPRLDSRPSTPPHLARRGSELELALRSLWARLSAALDALAHGIDQALGALRTDP